MAAGIQAGCAPAFLEIYSTSIRQSLDAVSRCALVFGTS